MLIEINNFDNFYGFPSGYTYTIRLLKINLCSPTSDFVQL